MQQKVPAQSKVLAGFCRCSAEITATHMQQCNRFAFGADENEFLEQNAKIPMQKRRES